MHVNKHKKHSGPDSTLLFLTSFSYPTRHAHPTHGLEMARAFSNNLGSRFLFVIEGVPQKDSVLLHGVAYRAAFGAYGGVIKSLHLRTPAYTLWLLFYLLRASGPTVVFVNDVRIGMGASLLRWLLNFRLIFESHGVYSPLAERLIYRSADKVIFVTNALQKKAHASYPLLTSKSVVSPNAVDQARYDVITKTAADLRRELGIPQAMTVGYIGRFRPGGVDKGVEFMLRALPRLKSSCRMLFVGGTARELHDIKVLADSLCVGDRVTFVPHVATELVPKYCKACDVLVYAPEDAQSVFHQIETSPMKLFEYMAAGRPIIASDTPAVREILDESCAYILPAGDTDAFVRMITAIRQNTIDAQERVRVARERVLRNTWRHRISHILFQHFSDIG